MPFGILLLMIKEINRSVQIPQGTEIELTSGKLVVKKNGKTITKKIPFSNKLSIKKEGNEVKIDCKKPTRRESALAGTTEAHVRNAIDGLENEYIYRLEICNVHFPMTVKIEGKKLMIKNFLGEKLDRIANILEEVDAKIQGNIVELKSSNKDAVGQSAANIELATKVRNRDRRVFQDGIYLIEKGGKVL
jgi:large subunit ribosomal protein L6